MLGHPEGALPLLGTDLRAGVYPALQWNGALLHRVRAPLADSLLLIALASARPGATGADVARGLAAGLAVADQLQATPPASSSVADVTDLVSVADVTHLVLAGSACAAATRGSDPAEVAELHDLAGALMLVITPSVATDLERDLWAGHWLAAGWLVPQLAGAGITSAPGTFVQTVAALTGGGTATPEPVLVGAPAGDADLAAHLLEELR